MSSTELPQGMAANTIPLLLGHPDPATLLMPDLQQSMQRFISTPQYSMALQYGAEQGTGRLIDFLVEKIQREQALAISFRNLMVTAGSTGAVDMLSRLFVKPGGVILVEAPTYVDSLHVFRDHSIELISIPMDDDGLLPGELERQVARLHASGKDPGMLYTIPNFHNPTGRTLSEARRREIIELAQRYGFLIVEDDVYRDLSFKDSVPTSFYALANGERAVSIGSFSKTLAPGLRLGWLVGSEEIVQQCVNCGTTQMGGGANPFAASIVAEYCRSGDWERHILHVRPLYKMRRDAALSALAKYMPSDVQWTHPAGGFFLWLTLPDNVFAQDVKRFALSNGVSVAAGEGFFVNSVDGAHNLRLAYSCASLNDIDDGIRILAQVIDGARS